MKILLSLVLKMKILLLNDALGRPGTSCDEFCIKNDGLCIKNDEFCIENDEFCIKCDGLCIKNDEFGIKYDELWGDQVLRGH